MCRRHRHAGARTSPSFWINLPTRLRRSQRRAKAEGQSGNDEHEQRKVPRKRTRLTRAQGVVGAVELWGGEEASEQWEGVGAKG